MSDKKLEKLVQVLELLKNDTITPAEVEKFLVMVLDVVKKSKENMEVLSAQQLQHINSCVELIKKEHSSVKNEIESKNSKLCKEVEAQVAEVRKLAEEVKATEVRDGVDGKDADEEAIVEKLLERIPKSEPVALDNGEQIVDKINNLPDNEDHKIDASHIKNLPKTGEWKGGGSRYLSRMADVKVSDIADNDVLKWNATNGRFENSPDTNTIASVLDSNSIDFTLTGTQLTASVKRKNTSTITLSSDSDGIFADVIQSGLDHGSISGLSDDDHTQYALLAGRSGGQTLIGGTAANEDLTLEGTSHATKTSSYVLLQPNGGNVGIGTTSPSAGLHVVSTNGLQYLADTTADATNKFARFAVPHYTNTEEPTALIYGFSSTSSNSLSFGGGSSLFNAATNIAFYTAANNTTTTGTERMVIASTGNIGMGTGANSVARLIVEQNSTGFKFTGAANQSQLVGYIDSAETVGHSVRWAATAGTGSLTSNNVIGDVIFTLTAGGANPLKGKIEFRNNIGDSFAARLTVADSGFIGIGTGDPKTTLHSTGSTIVGVANAATADANLGAGQVNIWVNEATNSLTFKVKYADGTTVKSGTVALA